MFSLRKLLLAAVVLLALLFPTTIAQAQESPAEPGQDMTILEWLALEAEAWAWDARALYPSPYVSLYAGERVRGLSEADSPAGWCCEQHEEAATRSRNAWHELVMQIRGVEDETTIDDAGALVCASVCRLSQKDCEACIANPSDPAWLQMPGVCHGVVQR